MLLIQLQFKQNKLLYSRVWFSNGGSNLVGNAVGQKDEHKVKEVTYLISGITMFLMIICGIALFIFAEQLMGIFTPDLRLSLWGLEY